MLIGLSGVMGAGKDAAADVLVHKYGFKRFTFAQALKDEVQVALASQIIPKGIHDAGRDAFLACLALELLNPFVKPTPPEIRVLLQQWGTEFRRKQDENYWVKKVQAAWYALGKPDACITDVRFGNELEWVQSEGGICVLIERETIYDPNLLRHESERLVTQRHLFNAIVDNKVHDPSLRRLEHAVTQVYWEWRRKAA